jgi:hypothetical protein
MPTLLNNGPNLIGQALDAPYVCLRAVRATVFKDNKIIDLLVREDTPRCEGSEYLNRHTSAGRRAYNDRVGYLKSAHCERKYIARLRNRLDAVLVRMDHRT